MCILSVLSNMLLCKSVLTNVLKIEKLWLLYLKKKKTQEALESYNEKLQINIVFLWQELVYMESSEITLSHLKDIFY